MSCRIDYIYNSQVSQDEKSRLSDIHVDIFKKIQQSKNFIVRDGRLYSKKYLYHKAISDIAAVNLEQGVKVATLYKDELGRMYLHVNVLPLAESFKRDINYFNNDFALMEQEMKDDLYTVSTPAEFTDQEVADIWNSKVEKTIPKQEFMSRARDMISNLSYLYSKEQLLNMLNCL